MAEIMREECYFRKSGQERLGLGDTLKMKPEDIKELAVQEAWQRAFQADNTVDANTCGSTWDYYRK